MSVQVPTLVPRPFSMSEWTDTPTRYTGSTKNNTVCGANLSCRVFSFPSLIKGTLSRLPFVLTPGPWFDSSGPYTVAPRVLSGVSGRPTGHPTS